MNFAAECVQVDEHAHRAKVTGDNGAVFEALMFAPFLLQEFLGSGQYLDQLHGLQPALRARATTFGDRLIRVVDAGCNVGLFGLFAQAIVGPVVLFGFDPLECNVAFAAHNWQGIDATVFRIALGAEEQLGAKVHALSSTGATLNQAEVAEWETETGLTSEIELECDVYPLDAAPIGRVDLIKLDVEGSEQDVLYGARDVLHRDRPFVICSYEHPSNSRDGLVSMLGTCGYDCEDDTVNKLLTFSPRGG